MTNPGLQESISHTAGTAQRWRIMIKDCSTQGDDSEMKNIWQPAAFQAQRHLAVLLHRTMRDLKTQAQALSRVSKIDKRQKRNPSKRALLLSYSHLHPP